jgi:hypothetical protein
MTDVAHQPIAEEVAQVDRIIAKTELLIKIAVECGFENLVHQMRLELEEVRQWRDCLSAARWGKPRC